MKTYFKGIIPIIIATFFGGCLILNPEVCKDATEGSIILCGRVLIPALYPFSVCVLFIMNSGILNSSNRTFFITVLSMLGGYPIGAKLLDKAVENKEISPRKATKTLNFCVNAGPAFILTAVGNGILHSNVLGFILLFAHITASLVICLILNLKVNEKKKKAVVKTTNMSVSDNLVLSACQGAEITLNICYFVIFFSVIVAFIRCFALALPFLTPLIYLTEITAGLKATRNAYLISFLLGFGGFCIWCQIFSLAKNFRINFLAFAFFRILHGFLSTVITLVLIKVFGVTIPVFSNGENFLSGLNTGGVPLSISLLTMVIIFIISVTNKKGNIKILEEFM